MVLIHHTLGRGQPHLHVAVPRYPRAVNAPLSPYVQYRKRGLFDALAGPSASELEENERDYVLSQRVRRVLATAIAIDDDSSGLFYSRELVLGEVLRQFDSTTVGTLSGWAQHRFGFSGWGAALSVGRVGLATGSLGLHGVSTFDATLAMRTQADQTADGFVAVFDDLAEGRIDTLRLVVPPEPAARALADGLIERIRPRFPYGTHTQLAIEDYSAAVHHTFPYEVSHAADRLAAIMRAPADRRPLVRFAGVEVRPRVYLGGALRVAGDNEWMQLMPLGALPRLHQLVAELQAT